VVIKLQAQCDIRYIISYYIWNQRAKDETRCKQNTLAIY